MKKEKTFMPASWEFEAIYVESMNNLTAKVEHTATFPPGKMLWTEVLTRISLRHSLQRISEDEFWYHIFLFEFRVSYLFRRRKDRIKPNF